MNNVSPYQWRAGLGYLPNPSQPAPLCTSYPTFTSPQLQPGYAHHLFYPSTGQIAAIPPPPPPQPKKVEEPKEPANKCILPPPKPATTVAGSVTSGKTSKTLVHPSNTSCTCTTTYSYANNCWTTICKCSSEEPPAKKAEPKKSKTIMTETHSTSALPPPTLRPGENYMFPPASSHTMLHIFNKAAPIWLPKYLNSGLGFKMFKVATTMPVGGVIERVMKRKTAEECEGWAVTEVVETGDGGWAKGTTVKWGSEKAKGSLGGMGWGVKRGDGLPPVWVVVHKD